MAEGDCGPAVPLSHVLSPLGFVVPVLLRNQMSHKTWARLLFVIPGANISCDSVQHNCLHQRTDHPVQGLALHIQGQAETWPQLPPLLGSHWHFFHPGSWLAPGLCIGLLLCTADSTAVGVWSPGSIPRPFHFHESCEG